MNAPQLIYLALLMVGIGISLAKHGQPKSENHFFPLTAISSAISFGLLYWGGFFGGAA